MKNTKWIVAVFAFLVLSGILLAVKYGLQPRPIPLIRLSSFETPHKLTQSVLLRLNQEIKQMPLLLLGYQPEKPNQLEFIREFIKANTDEKLAYNTLVADENLNLGEQVNVTEKIDSKGRIEQLAEGLKTALAQNRRVLVVLPAVYSAQIVSGNVADQLKQRFQLPISSLTVVELPRAREDEKNVTIPCQVPDADASGVGALGCAILQTGRANYRKKMEPGQRTAVVDQRGASDYFIFYSNE